MEPVLHGTGGQPGGTPDAEEPRRGVCAVVCGAFAVGTCLHMLAAVAAAALGIGMLVIAFTGDTARWIGLGLVVVLAGLATVAVCAWRRKP